MRGASHTLARLFLIAALSLFAAAVAAAEPQVRQRAFEEIPDGVFIRGGSTIIDVDPRCPSGCTEHQRCQQHCEDRACAADAAPGSACSACRWRCSNN